MSVISKIVGFVDSLLHPSARRDPLSSTRHRALQRPLDKIEALRQTDEALVDLPFALDA